MAYANQKEVDNLNKILKRVDKNFELSRFYVDENENVIRAGVKIQAKGNKAKINALKEIGFETADRFKEPEPFGRGYASERYKGYQMYVVMEKSL